MDRLGASLFDTPPSGGYINSCGEDGSIVIALPGYIQFKPDTAPPDRGNRGTRTPCRPSAHSVVPPRDRHADASPARSTT